MKDLHTDFMKKIAIEMAKNFDKVTQSYLYERNFNQNRIHLVEHTKDGFIINHIIYDQFKKVRFDCVRLT